MNNTKRTELLKIEEHGSEYGWVSPMTKDNLAYIAHYRSVFKRYNIDPSKATRLEYDFVTRVTDSEFYLQQAQA